MPFLFLFLDGIGLGANDPEINPFVRAEMPTLRALLGNQPIIADTAPYHGKRATLLALDANLGVDGLPQSATGQATLLTGINIPAEIGYHYGPKPNPDVRRFLSKADTSSRGSSIAEAISPIPDETAASQVHAPRSDMGETIFSWIRAKNKKAALLSAYPDGYFKGIESGKRLYSAIPLAVTQAGFPLMTAEDVYVGRALSAGFTGKAWRKMLKDDKAPLYAPKDAGAKLAQLASQYDFAFFES